ncbi:hypothetical protein A2U01_0061747, partial [Trifolium medium]|nr:hypothetical protein [Trifolium medium]
MDCISLVWYILAGLDVDIARIIANEMKAVAESGIKNESAPVLTYPGLIMGLCSAARVTFPAQVSKVISGPINDDYISRHCKNKRIQRQQQGQQANQPPAAPAQPKAPQ